MDYSNWRIGLLLEAREKIVRRILDAFQRLLPMAGQDVRELLKLAWRFEEKIYQTAADQQEYLRKISLKILSLEREGQSPATSLQAKIASVQGADNAIHPAILSDWRAGLPLESRENIVKRIMDTLERHTQGNVGDLLSLAWSFEEKIFQTAVNQEDYLKRISANMNMLAHESSTQTSPHNFILGRLASISGIVNAISPVPEELEAHSIQARVADDGSALNSVNAERLSKKRRYL